MPTRSTTERGWRLAGLLVLFVIACFWMPLGARDAGGVSSVIPALGPSSLAQPSKAIAHPSAQPHGAHHRPAPVRSRVLVALVAVVLVAFVVRHVLVVAARDDIRPRLRAGLLRTRGPPVVL